MEDRLTDALYLEMTDTAASDYARERVPVVLRVPGVERATWWENVNRDRSDLPRKVPEFGLLGVYEVDRTFEAPPPSDDLTAAHFFRRTPRPGQGSLTGRPTVGLSLVLVSPRAADGAQALRDWADFVHIRTIAEAAVPGFTMITPYEHHAGGDPRFLHFYEMDTDDPEAAFIAMPKLVMERIGPPGTPDFDAWANHEELRIMYVNSFRRVGELRRSMRSGQSQTPAGHTR
jgi:hypothetical protein